ncbi:MAG: hypothetical protein ACI4Q6_05790 [Huintestinicola sp.]
MILISSGFSASERRYAAPLRADAVTFDGFAAFSAPFFEHPAQEKNTVNAMIDVYAIVTGYTDP